MGNVTPQNSFMEPVAFYHIFQSSQESKEKEEAKQDLLKILPAHHLHNVHANKFCLSQLPILIIQEKMIKPI